MSSIPDFWENFNHETSENRLKLISSLVLDKVEAIRLITSLSRDYGLEIDEEILANSAEDQDLVKDNLDHPTERTKLHSKAASLVQGLAPFIEREGNQDLARLLMDLCNEIAWSAIDTSEAIRENCDESDVLQELAYRILDIVKHMQEGAWTATACVYGESGHEKAINPPEGTMFPTVIDAWNWAKFEMKANSKVKVYELIHENSDCGSGVKILHTVHENQ